MDLQNGIWSKTVKNKDLNIKLKMMVISGWHFKARLDIKFSRVLWSDHSVIPTGNNWNRLNPIKLVFRSHLKTGQTNSNDSRSACCLNTWQSREIFSKSKLTTLGSRVPRVIWKLVQISLFKGSEDPRSPRHRNICTRYQFPNGLSTNAQGIQESWFQSTNIFECTFPYRQSEFGFYSLPPWNSKCLDAIFAWYP